MEGTTLVDHVAPNVASRTDVAEVHHGARPSESREGRRAQDATTVPASRASPAREVRADAA